MKVEIPSAEKSYTVTTGRGILNDADKYFDLDRKVLIVTDDGVPGEYAETVAQKCGEPRIFRFKHGEKSKNPRVAKYFERTSFGFVYERGLRCRRWRRRSRRYCGFCGVGIYARR